MDQIPYSEGLRHCCSGCAKVEGKEDSVSVTGTRGCFKDGQTQPDVRVLRPIAHYGDFGDDGRLKDPLPYARDTPIQRRVKLARLRRCDVLALILYTGVFVYLCGCSAARVHAVLVAPHGTLSLSQCVSPEQASSSRSSSRSNHGRSSDFQGPCLCCIMRSCAALASAERCRRASSLS